MLANLVKLFRIAVVVALTFAAPPLAEARSRSGGTEHSESTPITRSDSDAEAVRKPPQKGDPKAGLLWIGGAVLVLVFLAWLAMRIGDVDQTSDKVPN